VRDGGRRCGIGPTACASRHSVDGRAELLIDSESPGVGSVQSLRLIRALLTVPRAHLVKPQKKSSKSCIRFCRMGTPRHRFFLFIPFFS
jgi:hypothetical protein